jgi:hypothetical protein
VLDVTRPPEAHWYAGLLGEFMSILEGLYQTRSSRGILRAKRSSAWKESGLLNTDFVSFDLQPYGNNCQTAANWIKSYFVPASELDTKCHTAMSWALSLSSRDAMDVSFNTRTVDLPSFFAERHYTTERLQQQQQDLQAVVDSANAPGSYNDRLNSLLENLQTKDPRRTGAYRCAKTILSCPPMSPESSESR